ncbi:MAG: hypothetical protein Q9227_007956 [Pyrenula ochraceoflavens]
MYHCGEPEVGYPTRIQSAAEWDELPSDSGTTAPQSSANVAEEPETSFQTSEHHPIHPHWVDHVSSIASSRTSIQSYGDTEDPARRISSLDPGDERKSFLEMPVIEVPGSLAQTFEAWNITESYTQQVAQSSQPSSSSADSSPCLRPDAFAGHRDTLARIRFSRQLAPELPPSVFNRLCLMLSSSDYKSLRLTSKVWLRSLPQPNLPPSYFLPREVIQHIQRYLNPQDFNASRYTCRAWLLASLDKKILTRILKKAGYWHAADLDLRRRREKLLASREMDPDGDVKMYDGAADSNTEGTETQTEEWVLSKRLATECMLSSTWHGGAFTQDSTNSRFHVSSTLDFTMLMGTDGELKATQSQITYPRRPLFTISGCGKFLLMTQRQTIWVFKIRDALSQIAKLITVVNCPNEVRAVSMDTSCNRYAIAVLLEGRMGIVCDIQNALQERGGNCEHNGHTVHNSQRLAFTNLDIQSHSEPRHAASVPQRKPEITTSSFYPFKTTGNQFTLPSHAKPNEPDSLLIARESHPRTPVETGPRSIYRNLGTVEDPPRSVAICPQRRCVAFGCGMGVELHWVDALSEIDLNRWFPLSAPADYLFFLTPRSNTDGASKLRLISSASGHPSAQNLAPVAAPPRHSISGFQPPQSTDLGQETSLRHMTNLFLSNFSGHSPSNETGRHHIRQSSVFSPIKHELDLLRAVDCDHYCALPLSDGTHMLFTDPETGLLCLGSDAPLGNPTKLLRKVVCVPPPDIFLQQDTEAETPSAVEQMRPYCYVASPDLNRGVRIVAAYAGGYVVLYNLPSDLYEELKRANLPLRSSGNLNSNTTIGTLANSDLLMDVYMKQTANPEMTGLSRRNSVSLLDSVAWGTRSIRIAGVQVGWLEEAESFAVECSHGGVRVWGFSRQGEAKVWDLGEGTGVVKKMRVRRDGKLETVALVDRDGDVVMKDVEGLPEGGREDVSLREESPLSPGASPAESKGRPRHVSFLDGVEESEGRWTYAAVEIKPVRMLPAGIKKGSVLTVL